ncbi:intein/RHS repeat-associated protein [Tumebacillus sp. BK434]|uniref:polymorphic toxin-type HINT domain-containing protein n=1 Tax=Tumebacillus sp. BK434 TaxID=2512169 RepID=UPI00104D609E|nr:polymorphic toxin-type HINT domain-containing protein [Tumebacillus sp. BK434]TCP52764.1 intein/RHS repeat-associated protein [Tumebacillus sp. BK434]
MSILLSAALLLGTLQGTTITAQATEELPKLGKDVSFSEPPTEPVELVEERTENSKSFRNPDGSTTVKVYGQRIHYKDPNTDRWLPIDSNLEVKANGHLRNKANRFSVELKNRANAGFVDFTYEGTGLSFRPLFARAVNAAVEGNELTYENVAPNSDLTYDVTANGLKETIILKDASAPAVYSFEMKSSNLSYQENEDGSVSFFKKGESVPTLNLQTPFMVDANKNISYDVDYQFHTDEGTGTTYLDVVADSAWLQDPERAYPVQIDPTIEAEYNAQVKDTTVESFSPNSACRNENGTCVKFTDWDHTLIGYGVDHGYTRSLYQFQLPKLPNGAVVSNAYFAVQNDTTWVTNETPVVEARRIKQPWVHDTVTWNQANTAGFVDDVNKASYTAKATPGDWWYFDVTKIAKDWYDLKQPNYGMELRYQNESLVLRQLIASYANNGTHYGPALEITYVSDPLGGQSYWTFDGPVNMANRNLYLSGTDISYPGVGVDLNLYRAYNSRSTESGVFGYGWSSPLDVQLQKLDDGSFRLKEADGTIHFFEQNAAKTGYQPLPGLYWTLEKSGTNWLIKTPQKTTYTFVDEWLTEIRDAADNTVTYVRDANKKVSSIKDKKGNAITLTYGTNGKVAAATDPAAKQWSYFYDGSGNLTKVTEPAAAPVGGDFVYRYDSDRRLVASVTPEGKATYYQYADENVITAINPANGMTNSNFEVDSDGDQIPDHLIRSEGQPTGLKDTTAGSPYGQAIKVNVATGSSTPYSVYLSEKISVNPAQPHTLSGYVKATQSSGAHYTILSLLAYNASGTLIGEVEQAARPTVQGTAAWKQIAKTYTSLPAGTAFVSVKMAATNGTGAGTSWFDAIQFEQSSEAGEFVSGAQYTAYAPTKQAASYDGEGKKNLYQYNENMNMEMLQRDPSGMKLTDKYSWSSNERTSHTDPMGRVWTYQYNDQGSLTYSKDPLSHEEWNSYDAAQNLVAHQGPRGSNEKFYYTYDSGKNQKTSRDPYYTSQAKEHNADGNPTSETNFLGWADNLVDNSSFENAPNADGTPAHFSFNAGQKEMWSHEADAFVGKQAIRLSAANSNSLGYTVLQSDLVTVNPATEYVLAGYLKATQQSGTQNTVLSVMVYSSSDVYLGEVGKLSLNGSFGWQRWNTAIRPGDFPANTAKVRVKLANANSTGAGSSYFDAVQLQQNPVDTAYNLLDNSSFERKAAGVELPESWEPTALSGDYKWVTAVPGVGTNVYAGSRALSVATTSDTTGSTGYNYAQMIPYESDKAYNFSAFAKTVSGATATLKIAMFDANGTLLEAVSNSQYGTSDWKRLAVELPKGQAVAGTVTLKPLLRTGTATGTVYFDNVRLQSESVTTRYEYKTGTGWISKATNANGNGITYDYDASGNPKVITSPKGYVTNQSYDVLNRLSEVTLPGGALTTRYSYDRDGQLLSIKDQAVSGESRETKFKYNVLDQIAETIDPLGNSIKYSYTSNGNLKQTNLPTGQTVSYAYDKADRMTDVLHNGTKRYQYSNIDANGNIKEVKDLGLAFSWLANYDELNRMTLWKDNQAQVSYSYDQVGNVTQKTFTPLGSTSGKTEWFSYNLVDQPIAMTDADGKKIRFLFNEHDQLSTLQKGNNTIMRAEYDNLGQVTELRNQTNSGALLSSFAYQYDEESNLTSIQDQSGKTLNFVYTPTGELEKEVSSTGNEVSYTYDAFGNREQRVQKLADGTETITTYQYDPTHTQLVKVNDTAWSYDAAGRLKSNGKFLFDWDAEDRLTAIKLAADNSAVASYEYDHLGRRVVERIREHTTQFLYNGNSNRVVAEFSGGVLQKYYTWSPTGQLLSITDSYGGGATYYTVHNHRGDVINLTDAEGNIAATYEYDTWGVLLSESGAAAKLNPYLYAGYRYDRETGLYYLNARYYDPTAVRLLSKDPLSQMPEYVYVHNNPVTIVDPTGLADQEPGQYGGSGGGNSSVGYGLAYGLEKAFGYLGNKIKQGVTKAKKWVDDLFEGVGKKGCNCFTAGTKVLTNVGERPIEDIQVGDLVLAKNDVSGEMAFKEVEWLFKRNVEETYNVFVGNEVLTTTDEHPFWIVGKGWVEAKHLEVGDVLTTSKGLELSIRKLVIRKEHKTVYNFMVKDFHSYFVSNLGIWTHNSCKYQPSSVTGTGDHLRRSFEIEGNSVRINSGHGYNRSHRSGSVQGIGTMDEIEGAILSDVTTLITSRVALPTKNTLQRTISVNGSNVGYDLMKIKDGIVSISTYYPK